MESLFILVPIGLLFVAAAGVALLWASRSGQFDHLDRIGQRLPDDED